MFERGKISKLRVVPQKTCFNKYLLLWFCLVEMGLVDLEFNLLHDIQWQNQNKGTLFELCTLVEVVILFHRSLFKNNFQT